MYRITVGVSLSCLLFILRGLLIFMVAYEIYFFQVELITYNSMNLILSSQILNAWNTNH